MPVEFTILSVAPGSMGAGTNSVVISGQGRVDFANENPVKFSLGFATRDNISETDSNCHNIDGNTLQLVVDNYSFHNFTINTHICNESVKGKACIVTLTGVDAMGNVSTDNFTINY